MHLQELEALEVLFPNVLEEPEPKVYRVSSVEGGRLKMYRGPYVEGIRDDMTSVQRDGSAA